MRLAPGTWCILLRLRTPGLQRFIGRVVEISSAQAPDEHGELWYGVCAGWLDREFPDSVILAAGSCLMPISSPARDRLQPEGLAA